ncbi:MAG: formylglycine-generating enzyme family protein [Candidatus Xenobiia bacterium LiM19]
MKKHNLIIACALLVLAVTSSSRVWGGSSMIITIIGDSRNSSVKSTSTELNYLLQQVRASGRLREFHSVLWDEFRVYDMSRERDRTICLTLGIREEALPILSVLSINLFGEPQKILWKIDGSDTTEAVKALMGYLRESAGESIAVKKSADTAAEKTSDLKEGPKPEEMTNLRDGAVMRYIPAGSCVIGSPDGEGDDDEHPRHTVQLGAYYIYTKEVTNGQFSNFIASAGYDAEGEWEYSAKPGRESHPVLNVTWNDARAYCTWAGGQLPTEAQWEKAARGDNGFKYPWGDEWKDDLCNWRQGPPRPLMANIVDSRGTLPGGSFPEGKSPFGIMDMAGNVAEWCSDYYDEHYYSTSPQIDPRGPDGGEDRVIRGGSWAVADYDMMRCADRVRLSPIMRLNTLGFRVVKPL